MQADDLYALALSLLDTLTAHAPPAPPTPYSPHLVPTSSTSPLDALEARLAGTYTGRALSAVRARASALYAGSTHRRAPGARDYSVRGAVRALQGAIESFALDKAPLKGTRRAAAAAAGGAAGGKGARGWKERLASAALKGGVVLEADEVAEGMREVLELARKAGEMGSAQGFVLVGDLYLVRRSFLPQLAHVVLLADGPLSLADRPPLGPGRRRQSRRGLHAGVRAPRLARGAVQTRLPLLEQLWLGVRWARGQRAPGQRASLLSLTPLTVRSLCCG